MGSFRPPEREGMVDEIFEDDPPTRPIDVAPLDPDRVEGDGTAVRGNTPFGGTPGVGTFHCGDTIGADGITRHLEGKAIQGNSFGGIPIFLIIIVMDGQHA